MCGVDCYVKDTVSSNGNVKYGNKKHTGSSSDKKGHNLKYNCIAARGDAKNI